MLALRLPWYRRVGLWVRGLFSPATATATSPARPGAASGRVASAPRAEDELEALATSPTVYAAVNHRAQGITDYPIRVYEGWAIGGRKCRPVDPDAVPWVSAFMRLIQLPDQESADRLSPMPGEVLFAQIIVDLLLTGNFFVVPTLVDGAVIGLRRLHPKLCSIDRVKGEDVITYRSSRETRTYSRWDVFHGRLPSWSSTGSGEFGTGAGASLSHVVAAESMALEQTANVVRQGGADVVVSANSDSGANYLAVPANRKQIRDEVSQSLEGGEDGQRVIVLSADVKLQPSGLDPADLRAPEMMAAAGKAELMAIGVVPVAVGSEANTYATAVHQLRVQAEKDRGLSNVIEAAFLRPLARHFARRAGGMWRRRLDEVTARFDLSSHPGYAYLEKDAIERAALLVELGYAVEDATAHVGLDLPRPVGPPRGSASLPGTPGPVPGSHKGPRRPVGDGADPAPRWSESNSETLGDLLN